MTSEWLAKQAIAATVENHRRPQGFQACLQLTNDLAYAGFRVLVGEHMGKIEFRRAEKVRQCPRSSPSLKKNVVDLQP